MRMKYPNNLRAARDRAGRTQQEVADAIGVTLQAYQNYEYGKRDVRSSALARLCKALDCSASYILGLDHEPRRLEAEPLTRRLLPVVTRDDRIDSSGQPIGCTRVQEATNTIYLRHPESWWLVVAGYSMNRVIPEGALALIDPAAAVRNNDIAAIKVGEAGITLRRVYHEDSIWRFHAESHDPDYQDLVVDLDDPDTPTLRILGRMVSYAAQESMQA